MVIYNLSVSEEAYLGWIAWIMWWIKKKEEIMISLQFAPVYIN